MNEIPHVLTSERRDDALVKTFTLRSTKKKVGEDKPRTGEFPHFGFPMSPGEVRMIDNFVFKVEESNPQDNSIKVSVRIIGLGAYDLTLNDVERNGDVLHFGSVVEVTFRKFYQDGRFRFHVSAPIDIRVFPAEEALLMETAS